MKKASGFLYLFMFSLLLISSMNSDVRTVSLPIYLNTAYSFEERAADLVSRFTLEEKQGLLGNSMVAVPRLGVKAYNLWSEALHGVLTGANPSAGLSAPSSFPNSVAIGSSWDPYLAQRIAAAISDEARAMNAAGTIGLTFWSPVVEPIRDPRWGRTGETYGEDPFLVSQIASGFVRGMTGSDPIYLKSVPCAKHYFANNSEFDRHVSSSNMDSRDMREFYLAPYKKLIEEDNLPSIMSSYNAVNGVPTSASRLYLDTIARRTYGMKGYVTGDCAAIEDIYTGHYYVKTAEEATAQGLKAGVDSDCGSVYQKSTISALNKGLISMDDIDKALLNVFTIRMRTGEFDPVSKVPFAQYLPATVSSPANRSLAFEAATKSFVLLKNHESTKTNQKLLPINTETVKKIALIGPQADKVELGPYSGRPDPNAMISPYAGIKKYIADKGLNTEVILSSGGNTSSKSNLLYVAAFELVKSNGKVTKYDATKFSSSSKGITVGSGMGDEEQIRSIDDGSWTAYENVDLVNVDTIGVSINIPTEGGLVELHAGSPEGNLLGTINATTAAGVRAGGVYGSCTMMKIKINRLGFTGLQTLYLVYKAPTDAPIDEETLSAAKTSDVAIVFVGTDEKTATEEADRLTLLLPGNQVDLIKAIAAVNSNTIVVMQTLGCVEVEEFKNLPNIPGIIWTGYNGQNQGEAIAKALFGEVNPGGKLNATWYKSLNDLPAITDYTLRGDNSKNGRTLWYFNKDVSYEFGYGLSYTTFEYSNFKISKASVTPNDIITVSADVKNTGKYDGDEVVQVYFKTSGNAALQRPIKQLKGFKRVTIPAGQTKTVNIEIDCSNLWFWDAKNNKMTYDDGKYIFEIGSSSKDIRGSLSTVMKGELKPALKTVVADCGTIVMKSGATAQTSFTAAMSDDSFYDVSKATASFRSSNPEVASVDQNGSVTAHKSGVTTITATVTIDGVTKSGSFPIKVNPDLNAKSITVNNVPVGNFNPETVQYSFLADKKSDYAPVVSATSVNSSINVDYVQATEVPGTATVILTDYNTNDSKSYLINYGVKSTGDEFNGSIGSQWTWLRGNPDKYSLTEKAGSLQIESGDGDIAGEENKAENILLQSANSDWTVDTKIVCSRKPSGFSQNAGVIGFQDDDNFVKFSYRAAFGRGFGGFGGGFGAQTEQPGAVELSAEIKGTSKTAGTVSMEGIIGSNNTLYLRLVKRADKYTAYYSADGKKFKEAGSINVVLKDLQAGIIVCNGVAPSFRRGFSFPQQSAGNAAPQPPFKVAFDYFRISNNGVALKLSDKTGKYAVTDNGELIRSEDGFNWELFDFNSIYAGYYKPCRFIDVLETENVIAAAGVNNENKPVLYMSSAGNVWSERQLIYTDESGQISYLDDVPKSLLYDSQSDSFILVCENGKMIIPSCSHCNRYIAESSLLNYSNTIAYQQKN